MAVLDQNNTQNYEKVATDIPEKYEDNAPESYGLGVRHVQTLLIFASLTVTFIARAHLSVTIVAMTDTPSFNSTLKIYVDNNSYIDIDAIENITALNITNDNEDEIPEKIIACFNGSLDITDGNNGTENHRFNRSKFCNDILRDLEENNAIEKEDEYGFWDVYRVYPWPKASQEVVLGAFFLGYLIMTTPMGIVCQKWGGKVPLQINLFVSGVATLSTPWLAAWGGYKAVAASRVLIGLAQAGTYPGIHTLVAKWVPLSERARLGTYIYSGSMIGSLLAYYVGGVLAASFLGWPSIYWIIGIV